MIAGDRIQICVNQSEIELGALIWESALNRITRDTYPSQHLKLIMISRIFIIWFFCWINHIFECLRSSMNRWYRFRQIECLNSCNWKVIFEWKFIIAIFSVLRCLKCTLLLRLWLQAGQIIWGNGQIWILGRNIHFFYNNTNLALLTACFLSQFIQKKTSQSDHYWPRMTAAQSQSTHLQWSCQMVNYPNFAVFAAINNVARRYISGQLSISIWWKNKYSYLEA